MRGCLRKVKTKRVLPKGEHSWDIILSLGRGADGKYKQKWVRFQGTRKQADQKLSDLTGEAYRGEFVEGSKLTVGAWLDEWLDKAVRPPRRAPNTYRSYCGIVKNHLQPGLGHLVLQQLTPLQVERYYADCSVKPKNLSARTLALHHAVLTSALTAAAASGLLRQNVAKRATNRPRITIGDDMLHNVWSADEARRFLTWVKGAGSVQYAALFALALDSGLRKSELLGLQWQDVDGSSLRLDRQLLGMKKEEATGAYALDTSLPKGKRARSLDLSAETVALLREHKRLQAEVKLRNRMRYVDFGLMFAQDWEHINSTHAVLGWPLNKSTVSDHLRRYSVAAAVKPLTVHGLRHTCATLLLSAGVPPHVVQRRLGHRGIEMTLNLYAHVLPSMQADAASRLATLLHG